MSTFDLKHTILLGWPVLSVLLVFSVITLAVFLENMAAIRGIRARLKYAGEAPDPLILDRMEQRLAMLGTIANAAPFVGLLGTVIGILRQGIHCARLSNFLRYV
jgi:biopolymer transport protein ExbB